jgi:hypothetical protein
MLKCDVYRKDKSHTKNDNHSNHQIETEQIENIIQIKSQYKTIKKYKKQSNNNIQHEISILTHQVDSFQWSEL